MSHNVNSNKSVEELSSKVLDHLNGLKTNKILSKYKISSILDISIDKALSILVYLYNMNNDSKDSNFLKFVFSITYESYDQFKKSQINTEIVEMNRIIDIMNSNLNLLDFHIYAVHLYDSINQTILNLDFLDLKKNVCIHDIKKKEKVNYQEKKDKIKHSLRVTSDTNNEKAKIEKLKKVEENKKLADIANFANSKNKIQTSNSNTNTQIQSNKVKDVKSKGIVSQTNVNIASNNKILANSKPKNSKPLSEMSSNDFDEILEQHGVFDEEDGEMYYDGNIRKKSVDSEESAKSKRSKSRDSKGSRNVDMDYNKRHNYNTRSGSKNRNLPKFEDEDIEMNGHNTNTDLKQNHNEISNSKISKKNGDALVGGLKNKNEKDGDKYKTENGIKYVKKKKFVTVTDTTITDDGEIIVEDKKVEEEVWEEVSSIDNLVKKGKDNKKDNTNSNNKTNNKEKVGKQGKLGNFFGKK